jgi:hypothetical protein
MHGILTGSYKTTEESVLVNVITGQHYSSSDNNAQEIVDIPELGSISMACIDRRDAIY